ncbi:Histone-lysine N-methyltransferase, H3 lysine-36 specific [Trametes pubescens]|uniref:[histone H3]-lysine(36) N-trimethyltransferase n=1 Tax=Trametes pubescens TaxID=154538 RepID=A0A1M2W770_TRAPU|nr:Histone-lysine N-methyltransferase, H3 lysine-36 specific [Trametes pubescens]
MTELHVDSQTSAALLFESDAVKAESMEASVKEEEMVDSFGSVTVKEDSSEPDMSRSASVEAKMEDASVKSTPSATPPVSNKTKGKPPKGPAQLIGHLPRAEEDAMKTFTEIPGNHYQYGTLGKSREALESMTFQRKQYAPIEIVKTEMKGFGLRAAENIPKDAFIYEYVGDVVSQPSFLKRMRQYAEEGIRHFYFMMLQRDEYIDATKRGGIGRFANHSCNPNCYVAKWTVGEHVRMGIFANRTIKQHEELTFNYNVDRYGHDAQVCYCGEPNCVGFIGGKTQTDLAAMDDLYLDALGITEEVERFGLKGSKKKKGRKLDEDFIPDLKPIILRDIPKVVQAMRQTQSRKVLVKLLMRIKLTEELAALRQIMRLRGFSVMTNILEDYNNDVEVQTLAMQCMSTWPLIQRNKVEDSKVNVPVKLCTESENETVAELAKKLLEQWESLEYAYRIPKRVKGETTESSAPILDFNHDSEDERPSKRVRPEDDFPEFKFARSKTPPKHDMKYESTPIVYAPDPYRLELNRRAAEARRQQDVAKIIAAAAAAATAEANKPKPEPKASSSRKSHRDRAEREREREARKAAKAKHKKLSKEEREANKEKRLLKLIGAVVVKCMSKYKDQMDHDLFKKYAKELTQTIAEKEKKSLSYKEGRLETLSEEKTTKIKKFAKEYIAKILRKLEKSGQRRKPSSTTASSSTPDGAAAEDSIASAAAVADVMDLDPDETYEDHDDQGDEDHDEQGDEDDGASGSGSPEEGGSGKTSPTVVADPRIRHRASSTSKDDDASWDTDLQKPISSSWSAVPVGS